MTMAFSPRKSTASSSPMQLNDDNASAASRPSDLATTANSLTYGRKASMEGHKGPEPIGTSSQSGPSQVPPPSSSSSTSTLSPPTSLSSAYPTLSVATTHPLSKPTSPKVPGDSEGQVRTSSIIHMDTGSEQSGLQLQPAAHQRPQHHQHQASPQQRFSPQAREHQYQQTSPEPQQCHVTRRGSYNEHPQHQQAAQFATAHAHMHSLAAHSAMPGMSEPASTSTSYSWASTPVSALSPNGSAQTQPAPVPRSDFSAYPAQLAIPGPIVGDALLAGSSATPIAAPYPGRAASLPGTTYHSSQQVPASRSRPNHPASSVLATTPPHLMAAAAAAASGVVAANVNPGGTSMGGPTNGVVDSSLSRSSPRLRAQLAQHIANGHFPAAFPNRGSYQQHHHQAPSSISYERYTAELTSCIIAFLSPILPTEEEYRMKEATRRQLERLAGKVSPGAKLLAFGSMANGFALRNSDMDLCCLMGRKTPEEGKEPEPIPTASELVERLAKVLREETDFNVLPLPKARIPIIKISRGSTSELPYEISCDIGFENRLALENTRLLLSYAMVDPPRLRTLVLFLKVWTKRRKLNSPYMGTLSSYGYTLLVLYFLCHVKRPAVLPNLQRIPPTRPLAPDEVELNGNNIYFYDDMATLRKEWQSQNNENVAELLIDFFRYFAKDFVYSRDAISLNTETGLIPKDSTTWSAELCIEDPFQIGYNVSRTVTKDGLYTIRGEFMRATKILQNRHQRVSVQLAELCEEREDIVARAPDTPPMRNKYITNANALNPYIDARTMWELYYDNHSRRNNVQPSGFGGSFAFEEMARGLGRQRGHLAYPTAAMLAPLSQNGGLSPHMNTRTLREIGTKTNAESMSGSSNGVNKVGNNSGPAGSNLGSRHSSALPSSARSEDGGVSSVASNSVSAVHDGMGISGPGGKRKMIHASARTSPTYAPAVPHGVDDSHAVGEAWAFGSEIVFGSERFRLHPNPSQHPSYISKQSQHADSSKCCASDRKQSGITPRSASVSGGRQSHSTGTLANQCLAGDSTDQDTTSISGERVTYAPTASNQPSMQSKRASWSFSDGANRSQSFPRGSPYASRAEMQQSSASHDLEESSSVAPDLHTSLAGLTMYAPQNGRQSPTTVSDVTSQAETEVSAMLLPAGEYTAAWAQNQLHHRHEQQEDSDGEGDQTVRRFGRRNVNLTSEGSEFDEPQRQSSLLRPSSAFSSRASAIEESDDGLSEDILDELSRVSEMGTQTAFSSGRHSRSSSYGKGV